MKHKKSQVQMIETIGVLFVFFILIVLGLVFFVRVQGFGAQSQIEEAVQKQAINIVQTASFLPELQCSEENIIKDNCVDIEKLNVIKDTFDANLNYYFDIFGYATINVEQVYPTSSFNELIYDKDLPDSKNQIITQVPILLKDPINKKYNFGLMTITTYSK